MIRALGADQYDSVMDLWRRSGLSSLRPDGRDSREAFTRQVSQVDAHVVLGLEDDGRLVGVVVVTHDVRKGWINRLAVDPAERRKGYASQLVAAAENTLHEKGIEVIGVLIERENVDSLALFQDLGYRWHDDIYYLSKRDSMEA
jgi:ribosomal protein S18 acetylase RimI-like enzyme